jgi:UDP-glucose 4-epimerase
VAHYLVTGGCGFIGSHLVDRLLEKGHHVRVLDDLSSGSKENLSSQAELITGDVRDDALMQKTVEGIDGCFHLAAIASVPLSQERWKETHSVNVGGTITLFEAARKTGRFIPIVYASSAAVYGNSGQPPLNERSVPVPLTPYGADKLSCELHAHAGFHSHGLASIGLRFFNVYGPRQNPSSPYSGVISIFFDRCKTNTPITIFGDGGQVRDFVYIHDVVDTMMTSMQTLKPGTLHVLNVCTGRPVSILQLVDTVAWVTKTTVERQFKPARPGDIRVSIGDPQQLRNILGVVPGISLEQGLKRMVED